MDGFNNGSNFDYSGYSQRSSPSYNGFCCNCPGGICPRMSSQDQGQAKDQGMGSQRGCPGGNCCPGGRCGISGSGSHVEWQFGR
ncbi:uncharacterized protein [Drosophila kikkawai]|uniref:Uncharacterized protein n=1 Tax=Drosophila kikkawai TaxID=30033 RepID=A0A6P4IDG7_DROKI|nr:uncharacterized protein LOC108074266 [Drosophila kikkawai]KAH8341448.1 hypothetical protein KR059_007400 [Drosophila kikkawai]